MKKAIVFRHSDSRYPFLWESATQPPARWHGAGEGPAQYFADTSDGAWCEFLRHEGIRTADELRGIARSIWAVEIPENERSSRPALSSAVMRGTSSSYGSCQAEARRIRGSGIRKLIAPSAAIKRGKAGGWRVDSGLREGPSRDGKVIVLFGSRPKLVGWRVVEAGAPEEAILKRVKHFPKK